MKSPIRLKNKGDRVAGVLVLVSVTALWGVSFPLIETAVAGRSQEQILYFLFLRFGLASLLFVPLAGAVRKSAKGQGARPWIYSLAIGLMFFVGFYLQSWGLTHTDASRSAFVTVLSVPMVPFIAAVVNRRAPSRLHLMASLVATLGIGLVLAPGGELAPNFGDWLTLASAFIFALEIVALGYVTRIAPTLIVVIGQIVGVALVAGVALCFVDLQLPEEWPGLMEAVVITGFFCTTLALGGMTWGQARVRPEMAAVIFALEPVFACLFVWLLLNRGLGLLQAIGGLVVFSAVAYTARAEVRSGA